MLIGIGIFLFILSFISFVEKQRLGFFALMLLIGLWLLASLRYGNGSDYFSYAFIYEYMPENFVDAFYSELHSETGFKWLIVLAKNLGLSYQAFLSVISGIIMLLIGRVVLKESPLPVVSVTIFYYVYFMIYPMSAIRQGLALAIVVYAFTQFFMKGRHIRFILTVLIASTIHLGAISILLAYLIPLLYNRKTLRNVLLMIAVLYVLLANVANLNYTILIQVLGLWQYSSYFETPVTTIIIPIISKLLLYAVVLVFYSMNKNKISPDDKFYFYMYTIGTLLFLSLAQAPLATRLLDFFTVFEIILIPSLLYKAGRQSLVHLSTVAVFALFSVIFVKDLSSFTYEQDYYEKGFTKYRYFHIYNAGEKDQHKPMDIYELLL